MLSSRLSMMDSSYGTISYMCTLLCICVYMYVHVKIIVAWGGVQYTDRCRFLDGGRGGACFTQFNLYFASLW